MKSGKVLFGVVAGIATGAALGVLFAPEKGSTTRRNISNRANQYAGEIKDKTNALADGVAQKFQAVKDGGSRVAENWKNKARQTESDLKHNV